MNRLNFLLLILCIMGTSVQADVMTITSARYHYAGNIAHGINVDPQVIARCGAAIIPVAPVVPAAPAVALANGMLPANCQFPVDDATLMPVVAPGVAPNNPTHGCIRHKKALQVAFCCHVAPGAAGGGALTGHYVARVNEDGIMRLSCDNSAGANAFEDYEYTRLGLNVTKMQIGAVAVITPIMSGFWGALMNSWLNK